MSTTTSSPTSSLGAVAPLSASAVFLRRVLWLDAGAGLATGALQLLLPGYLAGLLGLPEALLVESGWAILAFTAYITFLATRRQIPPAGVWLLIGGNVAWGLGCMALIFAGGLAPTVLGTAFLAVQAFWVSLLAVLEWVGLRKAAASRW
ncbi:MAG: hypothetical protein Q8M91_14255 [Polaromonas sp.]|nr:hypothetical protein [Polaromonas sp.]MDP3606923.1 hypothetical protein [Polaromonas sp.]